MILRPDAGRAAMSEAPRKRSSRKSSSSFGSIKNLSVAVSIGFPLLVIGVLMLALLIVSFVGSTTFLFILAGGLVAAGVLAAAWPRVLGAGSEGVAPTTAGYVPLWGAFVPSGLVSATANRSNRLVRPKLGQIRRFVAIARGAVSGADRLPANLLHSALISAG